MVNEQKDKNILKQANSIIDEVENREWKSFIPEYEKRKLRFYEIGILCGCIIVAILIVIGLVFHL